MKKIIFFVLIILAATTLSGCTLLPTATSSKNVGGVFKSYDYGETWQAMNDATVNQKKSTIAGLDIYRLKIDPTNHKQIYLGSANKGVWYANDGGDNWQNISGTGIVYDLAPDPKKSGILYVSLGTKVYKTLDLGKNWQSIYLETRSKVVIDSVVVDPVDNLLIYLGTSNGEVYQTKDGGESWQLLTTVKGRVKKILINPKDNKIIYLMTPANGIYKTNDKGVTWKNLKDNYQSPDDDAKNFSGALTAYDLIFDLTQKDALVYASNFGLLKSNDGGLTWQTVKILTPANSVVITSLAINPKDNKQIYYATPTALYRSFDAGQTWLSSSSPSTRGINLIVIDQDTPNVLYLGMAIKK